MARIFLLLIAWRCNPIANTYLKVLHSKGQAAANFLSLHFGSCQTSQQPCPLKNPYNIPEASVNTGSRPRKNSYRLRRREEDDTLFAFFPLFPSCPTAPVLAVSLSQAPLTQWQVAPSSMQGTAAHAGLAGVVLTNRNSRNSRNKAGKCWKGELLMECKKIKTSRSTAAFSTKLFPNCPCGA